MKIGTNLQIICIVIAGLVIGAAEAWLSIAPHLERARADLDRAGLTMLISDIMGE